MQKTFVQAAYLISTFVDNPVSGGLQPVQAAYLISTFVDIEWRINGRVFRQPI